MSYSGALAHDLDSTDRVIPATAARTYAASDELRRKLETMPEPDQAVVHGYLTGSIPTKGPSRQTAPMPARLNRLRKWQTTPDREASLKRRRMLGSSSNMPPEMRAEYTESERAALTVIGDQVRKHGRCDLPIDQIAAIAGVSRTSVQNATRKARRLNHVVCLERPRRGRKSLTNIVKIVWKKWLSWLDRGSRIVRQIGFKLFHPTKNRDLIKAENCLSKDTERPKKGLGIRSRGSAPPDVGKECAA